MKLSTVLAGCPVLGQLDDLVLRIQKGPKTKATVVHHDQLKPYYCRDPLDNSWVIQLAQSWTPVEVTPPTLDSDSSDPDLGLSRLLPSTSEMSDSNSSFAERPATDCFPTSPDRGFSDAMGPQNSGGGVMELDPRSRCRRKLPDWFGEWVVH